MFVVELLFSCYHMDETREGTKLSCCGGKLQTAYATLKTTLIRNFSLLSSDNCENDESCKFFFELVIMLLELFKRKWFISEGTIESIYISVNIP